MLRIDRIMKLNNISTQDLAARMHVSPQYVSEVVNERKNITLSGLAKFANALQVPVAALIDGYNETDQLCNNHFNCPYCGNVINVDKIE
ncbi:MAG: helix-turn-helix transcriptional regulator [Bacteroidaceae bacterium]|nr:helix-turn-helix transcriptional regulator [Bacteroidaceae bacterium]